MKTMIHSLTVLIAVAASCVAWSSSAHADLLLNHSFSGELIDVDDPFGIFGQNLNGDLFSGTIQLCNGTLNSNFGGIAEYTSDVVNQPNRFSAITVNQSWQPLDSYRVYVAGLRFRAIVSDLRQLLQSVVGNIRQCNTDWRNNVVERRPGTFLRAAARKSDNGYLRYITPPFFRVR